MFSIILFVLFLIGYIYLIVKTNNILIQNKCIYENISSIEYRMLNILTQLESEKKVDKEKQKTFNNQQQEEFVNLINKISEQYKINEQEQKTFNNQQREELSNVVNKINEQYKINNQQQEEFNNLLLKLNTLNEKFEQQSDDVIEFNDIVKLFMDHAQQRAVRVLEFNETLNEFLELIDQTAQSGSILWIHDPFFRQFRSNLEEIIKVIQFHQQESLQSIQFLIDNNNDNNQEK